VAFRICDLNKDGAVEREEVLQVYQQVVRAMHKSGLSTESYSDPRNLVRSVSAPKSTSPLKPFTDTWIRSSEDVAATAQ
jgi:Ca2+-binding EF-hand superfamily protein